MTDQDDATRLILELSSALSTTLEEAQAWRDGLNTRTGFKDLSKSKVGCCFVAFGLDQHRRLVAKARSFLEATSA